MPTAALQDDLVFYKSKLVPQMVIHHKSLHWCGDNTGDRLTVHFSKLQ
jgi:hypothetical protein